ncbi:MAG: hypothetical protein LBC53_05055 [Spirochaetaceae bacterium]|jgi:hypothetical protein|nr:hypothetical protein [Spirochaetaceae bacterium]
MRKAAFFIHKPLNCYQLAIAHPIAGCNGFALPDKVRFVDDPCPKPTFEVASKFQKTVVEGLP